MYSTGALISNWTSFLMLILYDLRSRITKLSYMTTQFQINVKKRLVKAFTVQIFKGDINECTNAN